MTEEIIIDDIQVSKCRHFKYDGIKKPICRSGGCTAVYKSCLCKDNADCDYKQFKRLEQENKELKNYIKEDLAPCTKIYKSALEEIRKKAEPYSKFSSYTSVCGYQDIIKIINDVLK